MNSGPTPPECTLHRRAARCSRVLCRILLLAGCPMPMPGGEVVGALSGYDGLQEGILADKVGVLLHSLPGDVPKLLVFTQCYGGNMATDPAITGIANAAIASGTSPGEVGNSGGYDDDAARALRPGTGRTGQTVHDAGVAGKYSDENPIVGGTLALGDFSLEDTSPNGPIIARAVVLYFGRETGTREWLQTLPDGTTIPAPSSQAPPNIDETVYPPQRMTNDQHRATIVRSFAGQHQTIVISVGRPPGDASGNYQHPATLQGLVAAVLAATQFLDQFRDRDGVRQFIFFAGDHGELRVRRREDHRCQPGGACRVALNQPSLPRREELRRALQLTPDNLPGVVLFASFAGQNHPLVANPAGDGFDPIFAAGALELEIGAPGLSSPLRLTRHLEHVHELSGDLLLGNHPDEGISLRFAIEETLLLDRLLGSTFDATLINRSNDVLHITSVAMDTGSTIPLHREPAASAGSTRVLTLLALVFIVAVIWLFLRRQGSP